MTHKMRPAVVVSASARAAAGAIAGTTSSAAVNSGGAAAAAESPLALNTAAEVRQLIHPPWAELCRKGSGPQAKKVRFLARAPTGISSPLPSNNPDVY